MYNLSALKDKFKLHLTNSKTVSELCLALKGEYSQLNRVCPWCGPFSVSIEETKNHIDPWYYSDKFQSKKCVVIRQNKQIHALWKESQIWSLDDLHSDIEEISLSLCSWKALGNPRSVKDIKSLIENGFWLFDKSFIPKLSDGVPHDTEEVISWDDKNVLVGNRADNLCIVKREEWARICERLSKFGE